MYSEIVKPIPTAIVSAIRKNDVIKNSIVQLFFCKYGGKNDRTNTRNKLEISYVIFI